jgi:hypothetical protein
MARAARSGKVGGHRLKAVPFNVSRETLTRLPAYHRNGTSLFQKVAAARPPSMTTKFPQGDRFITFSNIKYLYVTRPLEDRTQTA